jgi:arylformamidase
MYFDITYPINGNIPIWPGSFGYRFTWHLQMPLACNNLSSFNIDSHFGTHLDAPLHFIEKGKAVNDLDFTKLIGEAFVVEIRGVQNITDKILENVGIPLNCKKLLLKTDNQEFWLKKITTFQEDFCSIDASGAQWIVDRGINLVGIDYLSIQRFHDGPQTHQILLGSEVIIVETLNLEKIDPGWYHLICLPIKLEGLEGAPVRAILKKKND